MRDVWWVIDDGCLNDYLDGSIFRATTEINLKASSF